MPVSASKIQVAFSVTNCICYDQRVLKIAEVVSRLNCDVTIIGRKSGTCCNNNKVPFGTKRFRMIFKRSFLFYTFFNIRLFIFLFFRRFDLLVANDLDTLLPNFLISIFKKIPLVYDSHEYFTGVPEIRNRPLVKWVWTTIEKLIFPRLKHVMTVSDSIAEKYESCYGIRPFTIRNLSKDTTNITGYSRDELAIPEDNLLLIFQGGGINIERGGEELIEAVTMTQHLSLLIIGSGDVLEILKSRVVVLKISDRIRFIPKVPWEELIRYTKSADAGLSLDKDTNLNYRFSLPNKLFDYISAGIPVIASDIPEVRKVIDENRCGIVIPSVSPEEISQAMERLRDDRHNLEILKHNAINASKTLKWEKESIFVEDFYKRVLKESLNLNEG